MSASPIYTLLNKRFLLALSLLFALLLTHYFVYDQTMEEENLLHEKQNTHNNLLQYWYETGYTLYIWQYQDHIVTHKMVKQQLIIIDSLSSNLDEEPERSMPSLGEQSKRLVISIHRFAGQKYPTEWAFNLEKQKLIREIKNVTARLVRQSRALQLRLTDQNREAHKISLILLIAELIFLQLILILLLRPVARSADKQFRQLEKEKEEAVNANNAKSLYLSTMSHEIRTPLNGVLAMTDLLMETDLTFEQRDYLGIVQASGKDLLSVISDILDFSRIESNQLELMEMNFSLKQLLHNVFQAYEEEARDKGIQLLHYFEPDVPEYITGDPKRLSQILSNLLSNALKFTREGEVFIRTSIQGDGGGHNEILFAVSDTGMGIPEDRIDSLFQPFKESRNSLEKRFEGTGLGLALSARLVELMKGTIWVESEINKGTTFYFSIPLRTDPHAKTSPLTTPEKDTEALGNDLISDIHNQPMRDLQILLAEDNTINQRLMERLMERIGYKLDIARDGREAVMMAGNKKYDVIFMDLQMPELDGLQATRKILKDSPGKKPYIIAMTANVSQEDKELCFQAGMVDYIAKPISLEKVKEMLSRFEK